jgi:hypothetical protein
MALIKRTLPIPKFRPGTTDHLTVEQFAAECRTRVARKMVSRARTEGRRLATMYLNQKDGFPKAARAAFYDASVNKGFIRMEGVHSTLQDYAILCAKEKLDEACVQHD